MPSSEKMLNDGLKGKRGSDNSPEASVAKKARTTEPWIKVTDALTPEDDEMSLEECCKRGKLLQTLLKGSGYIRDGFITEHYLKGRPIVFRDGATGDVLDDICSQYLAGLDVEQMLQASPSDVIHTWLTPTGPFSDEPASSIELHDPSAAVAALKAGAQLYFPAPQPLTDLMCTSIAEGLGVPKACGEYADHTKRSEIETFVCRKGHTTDWHTDFQTNFTIQLSGRKKWSLKASSTECYPIRGRSPHFATSSNHEQQLKSARMQHSEAQYRPPDEYFADAEEIILSPGDVLFHPAGVWHKVESLDDENIAINISIIPLRWADIIAAALPSRASLEGQLKALMASEVKPVLDSLSAREMASGVEGALPKLLDLTKPAEVRMQLADILSTIGPLDSSDVFVFNRLATVVEAPEGCELDTTDLEEEDGDDDVDSDDEDNLPEIRLRDDAEIEAARRPGTADIDEADEETEMVEEDSKLYSLHLNYCRDDTNFDDLVRVIIKVPSELVPLMTWLQRHHTSSTVTSATFKASDLEECSGDQQQQEDDEDCGSCSKELIDLLLSVGLCAGWFYRQHS
ncbi:hypothetical protein FOL46_009255 [Perkinsus olseni]|uniref:JmjC domain-containing protein n=1 Tax=Perkinsus olseni TaxID=32597 RepID=A0A7J6MLA2_PEROL|nr:hypothetical protein FOL46_009255 [Perkinsus olseni]